MNEHKKSIFLNRINKNGRIAPNVDECCWEFMHHNKNFKLYSGFELSFSLGNGVVRGVNKCAYELFIGEIPVGKMVLRKCENPLCVRPEHLYLGGQGNARNIERTVDGIIYKKCPKCKKWYPKTSEFFYDDKINVARCYCKPCSTSSAIESRTKNWMRQLLYEAKRDRRNKDGLCSLTIDDIKDAYIRQGGKCYWTGLLLEPSIISRFPSKPSLDRLDRTKGYTKDNIVLCGLAMNIGRNSSSKEVFENYILKLKSTGIDTSLWK